MYNINTIFLEEYKRLDRLCCDMYQSTAGVKSYIEHMKSISEFHHRHIPSWSSDLQNLYRLKNIRNRLSHEVGTLLTDLCTQEDIMWITDFHKRILSGNDPIAQLNRIASTQRSTYKTVHPLETNQCIKRKDESDWSFAAIITILVIILVACIYALFLHN